MQELRDLINGTENSTETVAGVMSEEYVPASVQETESETQAYLEPESETEAVMSAAGQTDKFAYHQLDEEKKRLYVDIFTILDQMASDITISSLNADDVDRVFQLVMNDHPELFYVQGYSMSKYTTNGVVTSISLSGKYTKTPEEKAAAETQIESYVNQCLQNAPKTGSDYEKVKYVYEYLVQHTEYDITAEDNQNICSVFIGGKSVCQGYAKATQYLLNQLDVDCTLVSGVVRNGDSHAWNLACVDGTWCYIDTTWGDASFLTNGQEGVSSGINYDYLCADDEIVNQTHQVKTTLELPVCDSKDEYYYVKEGTYFTSFDEEQLQELFRQGYADGRETITIKCADDTVYQNMLLQLIEEERIFDFLAQGGATKYMKIDESHTITFYL